MKKIFIFIFLIFSCNNSNNIKNDYCNEIEKIAKEEIIKGNIYYKGNIDEASEYDIFIKYGLIPYSYYDQIEIDSCFFAIMNKKIESDFFSIDSLNYILYNYKIKEEKQFDSLFKLNKTSINLFYDGVYGYLYSDKKYLPKLINNKKSFDDNILKKIYDIDSTFDYAFLWLDINKNGKVENVKIARKFSKKIDSLLALEIKKSNWEPVINEKKEKIKSRILYIFPTNDDY